jgi:hypothetical protein
MSEKHVDTGMEDQALEFAAPVKLGAGLLAALGVIFVIVMLFKIVLMPQDERYLRGCMQETAQLAGRSGLKARMYRTFPWYSPNVEPKNKGLHNVWSFCKEAYSRESASQALYSSMRSSVEGSHLQNAAVQVVQRIDNGWSVSRDTAHEREVLSAAIPTWDVNGHNTDVQRILESYNSRVSEPSRTEDYDRIFSLRKGHFSKQDICRNSMLFEKWKVAQNPAAAYRRIPCK